jgi:hypothetical protein
MLRTCDDYTIGKIAALSMYISVIFLLFQLIVNMICVAVITILPEMGIIAASKSDLFMYISIIISELILCVCIWYHIKRKYSPFEIVKLDENGKIKPFVVKEEYIERSFNVAGIIGILWILLMRESPTSIRIFLIILDGFSILFLSIFFVIRSILSRTMPLRTLASIALSSGSLYFAFKGHL